MGTKENPGQFDCYANAAPDEPLFVLLARDKFAPTLIWLWATLRELDDEDPAKVAEARQCCANMIAWAADHGRPSVGLGQAALAAVMELIRSVNAAAAQEDTLNLKTGDDVLRVFMAITKLEPTPAEGFDPLRWNFDMAACPHNGKWVQLLVRGSENPFDDVINDVSRTVGFNNRDDHGEDKWFFAGWNWEQDCFTDGHVDDPHPGEGVQVIAWAPMLDLPQQDEWVTRVGDDAT